MLILGITWQHIIISWKSFCVCDAFLSDNIYFLFFLFLLVVLFFFFFFSLSFPNVECLQGCMQEHSYMVSGCMLRWFFQSNVFKKLRIRMSWDNVSHHWFFFFYNFNLISWDFLIKLLFFSFVLTDLWPLNSCLFYIDVLWPNMVLSFTDKMDAFITPSHVM